MNGMSSAWGSNPTLPKNPAVNSCTKLNWDMQAIMNVCVNVTRPRYRRLLHKNFKYYNAFKILRHVVLCTKHFDTV